MTNIFIYRNLRKDSSTAKNHNFLTSFLSLAIALECKACGKSFKYAKSLTTHVSSKHPNMHQAPVLCPSSQPRQFECYLCNKKFTTKHPMFDHFMKQHTEPQPKRCSICEVMIPPKGSKQHSCDGLKLNCAYCTKLFESLYALKEHLDVEHVEKLLYVCDICHCSFQMRSFLDYHKTKHSRGAYACKKCTDRFDTRNEVREHMRVEHMPVNSKTTLLLFFYPFRRILPMRGVHSRQ